MFRDLQKCMQSPKRMLKCERDKKHMAGVTLSGRLAASTCALLLIFGKCSRKRPFLKRRSVRILPFS